MKKEHFLYVVEHFQLQEDRTFVFWWNKRFEHIKISDIYADRTSVWGKYIQEEYGDEDWHHIWLMCELSTTQPNEIVKFIQDTEILFI